MRKIQLAWMPTCAVLRRCWIAEAVAAFRDTALASDQQCCNEAVGVGRSIPLHQYPGFDVFA
jgi:hypothetical protein